MTGEEKRHLYSTWNDMKNRCNNPKCPSARYYHDKGIRVCDEWSKSFATFGEWAMANGYQVGLTIDRLDSDGNYEPSNCEWVTREENSRRAGKSRRCRKYTSLRRFGMSEQQENILREIAESVNALPDDLAQIAAAKISGFAEGVRAAQLAQHGDDDDKKED